ncbi:11S globulin-like [Coffea arabica]|uniref:11S globulin-like n=1 Tax=Coffea arabica TaxID=13443 RepID=A0ABM4UEP0_COFAR
MCHFLNAPLASLSAVQLHTGKFSFLSFFLGFLCLFHGCFSQQQQQQGRCRILRINPQQPSGKIKAEAGVTEFYDHNDVQFQCVGVAVLRHTIKPRGFLLPSYTNAPLLVYVARGRFHAIYFSTIHVQLRFQDRHQKIGQCRQGDILALPAGAAHWVYNEGDQDLVLVVLQDTTNAVNQLDTERRVRNSKIAGNPEGQSQEQQQGQQGWEVQWGKNIFRGFDVKTLSEAFNVNKETARKLQSEDDQRGHIVEVDQGLHVLRPPTTQEQEVGQGQGYNGLEETICTARLREIIDNPSRTDIYNPQATSRTLPHQCRICAALRRVQIVDHRGQCVLDEQLSEGQVVVVPMNYAVVEQAGNNQGFEWVGFNTNDNTMINTIAGRSSTFRGLPTSVVANALQIWEDEAQQLKFNRVETMIFSRDPRF